MNYSPDVIKKAYDELEKRKSTAMAIQDAHVGEIRQRCPEIYSVYSEISSTKDRLADIILSKGADVRAAIESVRNANLKAQDNLKRLLSQYGYPADYLEIKYSCPDCRDSGVFGGNRCRCVSELLNKYAVEEMNGLCSIELGSFAEFDLTYYPENYSYNGTNYNPREIMSANLKYCMEYAKRFPTDCPSVFMLGPTGLGKTYLSGCMAKEIQEKGYSVAFDTAQNYFHKIENEHFGRSDKDTLSILLNADLLILDDLGSEFNSQFNISCAYNIINSRLNAKRPTIISTNLGIDELARKYEDRVMSRLMGMFKTLRFIGDDIRQIKRRKGIFV